MSPNRQPFYHRLDVLFVATADVSERANSKKFLARLGRFLKAELDYVLPDRTELDAPCEAEPGDPADLM